MVILGYKTGQLGNRLFHYSHWLANSWEYGYRLYNPSFDEYGKYFYKKNTIYAGGGTSVLNNIIIRKIILFIAKVAFKCMAMSNRTMYGNRWLRFLTLPENDTMDLAGADFVRLREHTKCLIVQGWLYRDEQSFRKYADQLRTFFSLLPVHKEHIKNFMESVRGATAKVIVGLHIRRGDYQNFEGGRFYYSYDQYRLLMQKVEACIQGKVCWVICSNEKIETEEFSSFDVVLGPNQIVEDMYVFSECNYIVGPPSTYTGWASFMGKNKLYAVSDPSDQIEFKNI